MEKNYIWTDDDDFIKNLQEFVIKSNKIDTKTLRNILTEYFKCIKKIIQHIVPKTIMYFLITKFETNMRPLLYDKIQLKEYYDLLVESDDQIKNRQILFEHKERLSSSIKLLELL